MTQIPNRDEAYLQRCAQSMQGEFGGTVVIKITRASDPCIYPGGLWFDRFVGSTTDVAGVDLDPLPYWFILEDGSIIPSECAEIVKII